jgi:hypothetical protein
LAVSYKAKQVISNQLGNHLVLGINTRKMKIYIHAFTKINLHVNVHSTLYVIARPQEQPTYLSKHEWYTVEYTTQ